jgi:hypothetical protein
MIDRGILNYLLEWLLPYIAKRRVYVVFCLFTRVVKERGLLLSSPFILI